MFSRYQSNKEVVLSFVGMRTTTTIAFNCFIGVLLSVTVTGEHEFASEAKIHDERHIKEHLKNKINVSKMTEEQQRFHYFMMSDLDKDGRIDGTEIIQALSHVHNSSGVVIDRQSYQTDELFFLSDFDHRLLIKLSIEAILRNEKTVIPNLAYIKFYLSRSMKNAKGKVWSDAVNAVVDPKSNLFATHMAPRLF
ncbi:hypothetical protein DICVIV_10108 [Dictyocaulus viviparus]|uniref:EF-hand domain-containing protein n=1 Tax=Dictyocaulus viviparus TaxID=29172 RepID=A0A0D8XNC9_DICVI|nr:hypothetical protein DICVIV_10108 [Dictyocaulus viviparus]